MAQDKEAFLSRWSRRKLDADGGKDVPAPKDEARQAEGKSAEAPTDKQASVAAKPAGTAVPSRELPSLDKLTSESDFGEFMTPGVDDNLRRAALKKLFADPRFNVIDSMDIDSDDYSNLEKLSPEVAKTLAHAKRTLFGWDEERKDEALAGDGESGAVPQETGQGGDTSERNEEEGAPARDEEPRRAQAGEDRQSGDGPQRPSKKG